MTHAEGMIAFSSTRAGNADIYLMDAGSGQLSRLTTAAEADVAPSLSRDRTRIVFASRRTNHYDLYSVNSDGTGETRLTNSPDADETDPDISPDGRTVVFARAGSLYAINRDGSGERRLTNSPGNSEHASFNSLGDKLIFESDRGGNGFQLYTMNADGSGQQALTHSPGINTNARFSPDGSRIVYVSTRSGQDAPNTGIYLMNADGSNAHRLVAPTNSIDQQPTFSPDGQQVVFSSNRANGHYNLYTIHTDGTALIRLTNDAAIDAFPSWR